MLSYDTAYKNGLRTGELRAAIDREDGEYRAEASDRIAFELTRANMSPKLPEVIRVAYHLGVAHGYER